MGFVLAHEQGWPGHVAREMLIRVTFSTLYKRMSGRDRESNAGHLRGKQRRKTLSHPLSKLASTLLVFGATGL
jgi:hypothetical protein